MGPTLDDTLSALTNHRPNDEQIAHIERIRTAAKNLATVIHREAPASPERSTALTHLRTTTMFAVQSVILDPEAAPDAVAVTDRFDNVIAMQPPMTFKDVA